jgi:hypothetical protein
MPFLMDTENNKLHPAMAGLLKEIQAFIDATGMGPSYFGKLATGNSELVGRLKEGSEIRRSTEAAVRKYLKEERIKRSEFPDTADSEDSSEVSVGSSHTLTIGQG